MRNQQEFDVSIR
jgi:hypothetical protein